MKLKTLAIASAILPALSEISHAQLTGSVLYQETAPPGLANAQGWPSAKSTAEGSVVGSGSTFAGFNQHAVVWNPSGTAIDLNPAGFTSSTGYATDGSQQVGYGSPSTGGAHALLWSGSAASAVDLTPGGGFDFSVALGIGGGQQVGYASSPATNGENNAFIWTGTGASGVDIHPAGYQFSIASDSDGVNQVGYGLNASNSQEALLWSGTAASAVDLGPGQAYGVYGNQQVGYGAANHAMLWTGSAASAIDLNGSLNDSFAYSTNGLEQVGDGFNPVANQTHAYLWSGSAASAVDLQALLPASGQWSNSDAYYVDPAGNIFGRASGTYNNVTGVFAVEWTPPSVPEPASASLTLLGAGGLLVRRRRRA
jgi:hypothetical protein